MDNKRSRTIRRNSFAIRGFQLRQFHRRLAEAVDVKLDRYGVPEKRPLPDRSLSPSEFARRYLVENLLRKYDDGDPSKAEARLKVSMDKFMEAEEICYNRNWFFSQDNSWIASCYPSLEKARLHIAAVLGELDLNRVARGFGWGPGASTRLPRTKGDAGYKYSGQPEVTKGALLLGTAAILANPVWRQTVELIDQLPEVAGNRITTVPKDFSTDRTIAVEPCLNMYLQRGLGAVIRQKLKTVGIDLDTQENNRRGCWDNSLATIDFSMASDSVSQGLVKFLLPPAWQDFILATRSPYGILDDDLQYYPEGLSKNRRLICYNKVSSMGNGFTFELETLIFWALARAVVPEEQAHRILVYGDDVLIPVDSVRSFLELSTVAGFTPNTDKSYFEGPFRESCGMHVFAGCDVTPFYLKRPVKELGDLFLLHNNLKRWADRVREIIPRFVYDRVLALCAELRNLAPAEWRRPRIPDGYGDGAFIGSFAACNPRPHPDGWEYFVVKTLGPRQQSIPVELPGLLVKSLTNLHLRKYVHPLGRTIPSIYEPILEAMPVRGWGTKVQRTLIPWSAFG